MTPSRAPTAPRAMRPAPTTRPAVRHGSPHAGPSSPARPTPTKKMPWSATQPSPRGFRRSGVRFGEATGVAHPGPDQPLRQRRQLRQVVPVVVDPLVEDVADRHVTDLRMPARTGQRGGPERTDQDQRLVAKLSL